MNLEAAELLHQSAIDLEYKVRDECPLDDSENQFIKNMANAVPRVLETNALACERIVGVCKQANTDRESTRRAIISL